MSMTDPDVIGLQSALSMMSQRDSEADIIGMWFNQRREKMTKTLDDVKGDMSTLYEELRAGTVEIKQASELANITGKYLKAEQLILARQVFEAGIGPIAAKQLEHVG